MTQGLADESTAIAPEAPGRDHGYWLILARSKSTSKLEVYEAAFKKEIISMTKELITNPDYGPEGIVKVYKGCKPVEMKTQVQTTVSF